MPPATSNPYFGQYNASPSTTSPVMVNISSFGGCVVILQHCSSYIVHVMVNLSSLGCCKVILQHCCPWYCQFIITWRRLSQQYLMAQQDNNHSFTTSLELLTTSLLQLTSIFETHHTNLKIFPKTVFIGNQLNSNSLVTVCIWSTGQLNLYFTSVCKGPSQGVALCGR